MIDIELSFTAKMWKYPTSKAAWFFVTLPADEAKQVKFYHSSKRRGWGAVRVTATIGKSQWKTSIFPDSRTKSYLLPVKSEIRKNENLKAGDMASIALVISASL